MKHETPKFHIFELTDQIHLFIKEHMIIDLPYQDKYTRPILMMRNGEMIQGYDDSNSTNTLIFTDYNLGFPKGKALKCKILLLSFLDDDEQYIYLKKQFHNEFVMLIFYIKAIVEYVKSEHLSEYNAYDTLRKLITAKLYMIENNESLKLEIRQNRNANVQPKFDPLKLDLSLKFVDSTINGFVNDSIYKDEDIFKSALSNSTPRKLKNLLTKITIRKEDYSTYIKVRGTLMLAEYLNKHAEFKRKLKSKISTDHYRVILRAYEIININTIGDNTTNNIKSLRQETESYLRKMHVNN